MTQPRHLRYTLTCGAARVLNCSAIAAEIAESEGEKGPLLFRTSALNTSVLVKDIANDAPTLGGLESSRMRIGTKIYLPFDTKNVLDGGQTIFFGSRQFNAAIGNLTDLSQRERRAAFEEDTAVLRLIDSLPSMAPFLLRDRLDRAGIEVDPRYFRISEAEWNEIGAYIRQQFQAIVDALFPNQTGSAHGKLERLLAMLWDLDDQEALHELADAFRIPRDTSQQTFYAWKGVIYFTWEFERSRPRINPFLMWLADPSQLNSLANKELRKSYELVQGDIVTSTRRLLEEIRSRLAAYELAFDDLFRAQSGPTRFLQFLGNAQDHFQVLGISSAKLQHMSEVWDRYTERFTDRRLPADPLMELLAILSDLSAGGV